MSRRAVSLFTNCGAGDVGFAKAGFRFEVLAEIDRHRLAVAALNLPGTSVIPGDLCDTWPDVVAAYRGRRDKEPPALLAACPPCQGLSTANAKRGMGQDADSGAKDMRNLLVVPIAEVAIALMPRVVVVENVRAFLTRKVRHPQTRDAVSAAALLISLLKEEYVAFPLVTDLADYGVPQTRVRSFITFVRRGEACLQILEEVSAVPYPTPTHAPDYGGEPVCLGEALDAFKLPALDASTASSAHSDRSLHFVPVWSSEQYSMVAAIPPGSGASAWENDDCPECGISGIPRDLACCPTCNARLLRPQVIKDGQARLVRGFRRSSYRRLSPDRPAATITTASNRMGSDRTIHPYENRVLSPLECQKLQTLPGDFEWGEAGGQFRLGLVREMIGEAVPPRYTEAHGKVLADLLDDNRPQGLLLRADRRVSNAVRKLEVADDIH
ncbi:MAG: DNA cytosine methyltransferase [Bacteroidetes bacterium]|nr:DNA cytosine methyltransferase [Bacteroidota bacterium]